MITLFIYLSFFNFFNYATKFLLTEPIFIFRDFEILLKFKISDLRNFD